MPAQEKPARGKKPPANPSKITARGPSLIFILFFMVILPLFFLGNTAELLAGQGIKVLNLPGVLPDLLIEFCLNLTGIYLGLRLLRGEYRTLAALEKYLLVLITAPLMTFLLLFLGVLSFYPLIRSVVWYFTAGAVAYSYLARSKRAAESAGTAIRFPLLQSIAEDLLLLALGALLFALSFPNFLLPWGMFPLAFFCLFPVFLVIGRARWALTWVYGIFFAAIALSLYAFWLAAFHALALPLVFIVYSLFFIVLFPLLKLAVTLFPRGGFLLQCLIWVGYEYLKTLGFAGFSYGCLGYSQFLFTPLIQIADLAGVWGVTLLVVFPSALLAGVFRSGVKQVLGKLPAQRYSFLAYALVFLGVLVYGVLSQNLGPEVKTWRVALIQGNTDPWKNDDAAYKHYLAQMLELSNKALERDPDIVVWPETAVTPSIRMHSRNRLDLARYTGVIKPLLTYMETRQVPFVLGNDDIELDTAEREGARHYNAVFLMERGVIKQVYRKIHLVPFTEYFPYKDLFPGIYNWLRNSDTHFWHKGDDFTVFKQDGIAFATPVCFEDTFGYFSREFVLRGADVLVNLTNDAWSHSEVAAIQHMSMALFRAVENRRPLARCTTSGITCVIDANGRIKELLKPFTADFLVADVPVYGGGHSLYTVWGDLWVLVMTGICLAWLITGVVRKIIN